MYGYEAERLGVKVRLPLSARTIVVCTLKSPPTVRGKLVNPEIRLCPYCGKDFPVSALTREHIVPESVVPNGPQIWVCEPCNSWCGSSVDVLLRQQAFVTLMSHWHYGIQVKPSDKAPVQFQAKRDGPSYEGYLYTDHVSPTEFVVRARPATAQQNGVRVLDPRTRPGRNGLSSGRSDIVSTDTVSEFIGIRVPSCEEVNAVGLHRAYCKMLLGTLNWVYGDAIEWSMVPASLRQALRSEPAQTVAGAYLQPAGSTYSYSWEYAKLEQRAAPGLQVAFRSKSPELFTAWVSLFNNLQFKFVCPANGLEFSPRSTPRASQVGDSITLHSEEIQ